MIEGNTTQTEPPVILSSETEPQIEPQKNSNLLKAILIIAPILIIPAIIFGVLYWQTNTSTSKVKTEEKETANQSLTAIDKTNAIAIVNNQVITRADFERELESYRQSKDSAGPASEVLLQYQSEPINALSPGMSLLELGGERTTRLNSIDGKEAESAILDYMIWEELLMQEAEKDNVSVSEKQLDTTIRSYFGKEFSAALSVPEQDVKVHGFSSIDEGTGIKFALGYVGAESVEMTQLAQQLAGKSITERSQMRERLRRTFTVSNFHQKISAPTVLKSEEEFFDEEIFVETLRNKSNIEILLDGYVKPQPVEERRKDQFIRSGISNLLYGIESYFSKQGTFTGVQSSVLESRKKDIQTIVDNGGSPANLIIQERENAWCVSSNLNSGKKFCLDSTGNGGEFTAYCSNAACPGSRQESARLLEFKDINGLNFSYPEDWKQTNFAAQGTVHITLLPLGNKENSIEVHSAPTTGQDRGIDSFIPVQKSKVEAGGVTWELMIIDGTMNTSGLLLPGQKMVSASYRDPKRSTFYGIDATYETKNDIQMYEAFMKVLNSTSFK